MTTTAIRLRRVGLALSATLGERRVRQSELTLGCPKDFIASCMAACAKAGGQARLCPAYCERRKRETGCV